MPASTELGQETTIHKPAQEGTGAPPPPAESKSSNRESAEKAEPKKAFLGVLRNYRHARGGKYVKNTLRSINHFLREADFEASSPHMANL